MLPRTTTDPFLPAAELEAILEIARRKMRAGAGGSLFIAGPLGSGAQALLDQVKTMLPAMGECRVARPRLRDRQEQPDSSDAVETLVRRLFSTLATALAQPLIGVAVELAATSVEARKLILSWRDERTALELVPAALRACAREQPTVVLIEDAHLIGNEWWTDAVLGFAAEQARDLPLLTIFAVEHDGDLSQPADEHDAAWLAVGRQLVQDGFAEWRSIPRLSEAEVAALIGPVSHAAVHSLVGLTDGWAELTEEMWREWVSTGIVEYSEGAGRWDLGPSFPTRAGAAGDIVRRRLKRAFADDRARREAYRALGYAALEGMDFTPLAVAAAAESVGDNGVPAARSIELLDDLARGGAGAPRVIREVTPAQTASGDQVARMRFTSTVVWWSLRRYALLPSEERDAALALAEALVQRYGESHLQSVHAVARLYDLGGAPDRARRFRALAAYALKLAVNRWEIRNIVSADRSSWDAARARDALTVLQRSVLFVHSAGYTAEVGQAIETWKELAALASDQRADAIASHYEAVVRYHEPEFGHVAAVCRDLVARFQGLGDRMWERATLLLLGGALCELGDGEGAREVLEAALELCDASAERDEERIRGELAQLAVMRGEYDTARTQLASLVLAQEQRGDLALAAQTRYALGRCEWAAGDVAAARSSFEAALRHDAQTEHRGLELVTRIYLAHVSVAESRPAETHRHADEAVRLAAVRGDARREAEARIFRGRSTTDELDARADFQRAAELYTALDGEESAGAAVARAWLEYRAVEEHERG